MNDYFFNQICLKLPILGMHYKAITDQEQTLAEGLLLATCYLQTYPRNRHITSPQTLDFIRDRLGAESTVL